MKRVLLFLFVLQGVLQHEVFADGFGYTTPYRIARMSFPETGVIAELPVREGQQVSEGELLMQLDCAVLQSEYNMTVEQLRIRRLRHEKLAELREAGSVSPDEFERAKADLLIEEERVQRIRAQIDSRTLSAPFDGVVSEIKKELAESASAGTHVLTLVQLNQLQVEMHLRPEESSRLREGAVVPIAMDHGETVQGKVEFISPVVDAASNTVRVRFVIANPSGRVRSGVRAAYAAEGRQVAARRDAPRQSRESSGVLPGSDRQMDTSEDIDPVPLSRRRRALPDS